MEWRRRGTGDFIVWPGGRGLIWRMNRAGGCGVDMKWWFYSSQDAQQAGGFYKDFQSCFLFQLHM